MAVDAFYVTIVKTSSGTRPKAGQLSYALGPFAEHPEAGKVEMVRKHVILSYADGHWWTYGTTRVRAKRREDLPVGKLNEKLGITPTI